MSHDAVQHAVVYDGTTKHRKWTVHLPWGDDSA